MAVFKMRDRDKVYIPSGDVLPFEVWKEIATSTAVDIYAASQGQFKFAVKIASFSIFHRNLDEFNRQIDEYLTAASLDRDVVFFVTSNLVF